MGRPGSVVTAHLHLYPAVVSQPRRKDYFHSIPLPLPLIDITVAKGLEELSLSADIYLFIFLMTSVLLPPTVSALESAAFCARRLPS